jgi:hypothetical protein
MRRRHVPLVVLAGFFPLSACGEAHPGSRETSDTHSVAELAVHGTKVDLTDDSSRTGTIEEAEVGRSSSLESGSSATSTPGSPALVATTGSIVPRSGVPLGAPAITPMTPQVASSTVVPNIPSPPVADTLPPDPVPAPSTPISTSCDLAPFASCVGADLRSYDLSFASLQGADLSGANLAGVDLTGADLMEANLTGANLTGARLDYAVLMGATLVDARLSRAIIADAMWDDSTVWPAGFTPPY